MILRGIIMDDFGFVFGNVLQKSINHHQTCQFTMRRGSVVAAC